MSDRQLVPEDIPLLLQILAEYSYRLEELAAALGLPVIKEPWIGSSNTTMFHSIIEVLMNVKSHPSKPLTLSSIRQALESPFGQLSNHLSQNFTLQDVATEIADFIVRKEEIIRSTAHIMIVGFPGNGKSHLLDNLLGNPRRTHYSSTGVSDSVVVVDVEAEDSTSHTSAFGIDSTWKQIETRNSLMIQVQNCTTLTATKYSGKSEEEYIPSISSLEMSATHLIKNVKSILQHNQVKSFDQLKSTISLYFRDTGGQMEFQEILTILIYGPSIFFFVMKTHVSLDQPLTLEYRRGNEVINEYKSSTTTRQALVQTLASIDATMKPTGITTHDPLVFIIGTHTDKLGAELKDKEERIKAKEEQLLAIDKELEKIITTHGFQHLVEYKDRKAKRILFPVDNISDEDADFQVIRQTINSKIVESRRFQIKYPVSYLLFCLELRNENKDVLTREECVVLAAKFEIKGEEEVTKMLLFLHHRIGIIRYYDVDGLRHLVIKEPQVLFNKLTELIVKTFPSSPALLPNDLDRGIVEAAVLDQILSEDCQMTTKDFLCLLVHLRIITSFTDDGTLKYFIPAVLNHLQDSVNVEKKSKISALAICFKCHHCPKGLFGTIVCHFMSQEISKNQGQDVTFSLLKDSIFRDQVCWKVYKSGEIQGTVSLKMNLSHIELTFCPDENEDIKSLAPICNNLRLILLEAIHQSLELLRYNPDKVAPVESFRCNCGKLHPIEIKKNKVTIKCEERIYMEECSSCWFNLGEFFFLVHILKAYIRFKWLKVCF